MIVTEYMENGALDRYLRVSWAKLLMYYESWILHCQYCSALFFLVATRASAANKNCNTILQQYFNIKKDLRLKALLMKISLR